MENKKRGINQKGISKPGTQTSKKLGGTWTQDSGSVDKRNPKAIYVIIGAYMHCDVPEHYTRTRFFEVVETKLRKEAFQILNILRDKYDYFILDFNYPTNEQHNDNKGYVSVELNLIANDIYEYTWLAEDFDLIGGLLKDKLMSFEEFRWL